MNDDTAQQLLTTNRKALTINLDTSKYGTFAEIGAGQEAARIFFQAGGAAGTIAKTMSAYDMTFSDSIYGKCKRYVSEERLNTMLDHEYTLLLERLSESKGKEKKFFAYANTVKAKSYKGPNNAHGWHGIRYQMTPGGEYNEIIIHARMWDKENVEQQEAIGILGTNLIYAAFYLTHDPEALVNSLHDNLGYDRIEVDLIRARGPDFDGVHNRILNLMLVRNGLTNAVLFSPDAKVVQPSDVLRKSAILVERGSFRPVTRVNMDMLNCAGSQFVQEPEVQGKKAVVLAEITMNNLLASGELDNEDFLARVDTLATTGVHVLISNYFEFFRLTAYFRRYTQEMIGVAMGINNLLEVFNREYYKDLKGGILENFGRLFSNSVKLYIYPMRRKAYRHYLEIMAGSDQPVGQDVPLPSDSFADDVLITCENLRVEKGMANLYRHLCQNGYIEHIEGVDQSLMGIFSRDVLTSIASKTDDWEKMVPDAAVACIKENQLFGYACSD